MTTFSHKKYKKIKHQVLCILYCEAMTEDYLSNIVNIFSQTINNSFLSDKNKVNPVACMKLTISKCCRYFGPIKFGIS